MTTITVYTSSESGIRGFLAGGPVVAVRDGYLRCELPQAIDAGRMEKAQIVLQTVMTGLTDIQKIYPNLIRIQQEEWRQADAYDESSALRS